MADVKVRSSRARRLAVAATPVMGCAVCGLLAISASVRSFTWFGVVVIALAGLGVAMSASLFRMQLRTERRMTAGMVQKYGQLRRVLAEIGDDHAPLVAREDNVVILPAGPSPAGFMRFDRDEIAPMARDRRAEITLVCEEFHLHDAQPLVTHRLSAVAAGGDSASPGLTQDSLLRTPRDWWRGWKTVRALNKSGVDVPSEQELDDLIRQIRSAF
ncbi:MULTISPECIES: hypothetical protein [Actinomycetes]|uniref:hypothetical protein n=1 Tax=Actinomycetes TaxID=1760 RepID=UPI0002FBF6CD|nr:MULTISPECIES: hypothetical protein [Actinomycetes]